MRWIIGGALCFVLGVFCGFSLRNSAAELQEAEAKEAVETAKHTLKLAGQMVDDSTKSLEEAKKINRITVKLLKEAEDDEDA